MNLEQALKIEEYLKSRGGSFAKKPRYMHHNTFLKLIKKHNDYEYNYETNLHDEAWRMAWKQ